MSLSIQSDELKLLLLDLKCTFRLWVLGAGLLFEAARCFSFSLPFKSKTDDENFLFVCVPAGPGPAKPAGMETVGRQRSSSDPHNPVTPERNSSVYGERHFLSASSEQNLMVLPGSGSFSIFFYILIL